MDNRTLFLGFLGKFREENPRLLESITKAFNVIFEANSTEEQVNLIKTKLSTEKIEETTPDNSTSLNSLVPEESSEDSIELELKDLEKLY